MDRLSLAGMFHRTRASGVPVPHSHQDKACLQQVLSVLDRLCPLRSVQVRLCANRHSALGKSFPAV